MSGVATANRRQVGTFSATTAPLATTGGGGGSGALVPDPEMPADYLQVVGLHDDEVRLMGEDGYERFLEALRTRDALLVTDPERAPVFAQR